MSGLSPATSSFDGQHHVRIPDARCRTARPGSSDEPTPSAASISSARSYGCDGRDRLRHPAEDDPPGLVPLELDGDDAVARLERDHAQLQRRTEDERSSEARMPGERNLVSRA